jgi:hypothetical protein
MTDHDDRCGCELTLEAPPPCLACGALIDPDPEHDAKEIAAPEGLVEIGYLAWRDDEPDVMAFCLPCFRDAIKTTGAPEGDDDTVLAELHRRTGAT